LLTNDSIARDLLSSPHESVGHHAYSHADELKQAWGKWVSRLYSWQWFVTLTFRDPKPNSSGWDRVGWGYAKRAYNEFLGRVRPALGDLYWFRAFETQKWRGVPHIHALVGGLDDERYAPTASWWWQRYGFSRFLEYDPKLGAGYYLCKYVTKELSDVQFSDSLKAISQKT
jgi:hypothetical protein